ncbi:MAG: hypothetical protein RMM17_02575 [Acidobacteriota bacterium]|nr:hypothetical protein [Blastocatellia bacterium]MDW8411552.1 hypothetical protein [Acidobacteriota bacterium]
MQIIKNKTSPALLFAILLTIGSSFPSENKIFRCPCPKGTDIGEEVPPAFPGAEGFGARATGGRGGKVIYVTTLDSDPNGEIPGSLNWALRQPGAKYILFKVSGVIHAPANVVHGNVTIAGQTSPGGIIIRGLICDGHYEQNDCSNLIVRHIRSRPARHIDGNDVALDDALRLDGIRSFIIDHCSFANAIDEVAQLSWASNGTIQNSIFAETVGDHAQYGGVLMNYSHPDFPQDNLSLHHNMWHRLEGRMPEITCEASNYPDLPGQIADCASHPLKLELSNNLLWDPGINIWYGRDVDGNPDNGPYRLKMNWVNNYAVARSDFTFGLILHDVLEVKQNELYFAGNQLNLYPNYSDYQLAYCCNDFNVNNPNTDFGVATRLSSRHNFPKITYTPTNQLIDYMITNVGAFPRDAQDRRFIDSLRSGVIDTTARDKAVENDAFLLDFTTAPTPPQDTDADGMPDWFEIKYRLDPSRQDHNGSELSLLFTGIDGYTNLECYLNWLADHLVTGAELPTINASSKLILTK